MILTKHGKEINPKSYELFCVYDRENKDSPLFGHKRYVVAAKKGKIVFGGYDIWREEITIDSFDSLKQAEELKLSLEKMKVAKID